MSFKGILTHFVCHHCGRNRLNENKPGKDVDDFWYCEQCRKLLREAFKARNEDPGRDSIQDLELNIFGSPVGLATDPASKLEKGKIDELLLTDIGHLLARYTPKGVHSSVKDVSVKCPHCESYGYNASDDECKHCGYRTYIVQKDVFELIIEEEKHTENYKYPQYPTCPKCGRLNFLGLKVTCPSCGHRE